MAITIWFDAEARRRELEARRLALLQGGLTTSNGVVSAGWTQLIWNNPLLNTARDNLNTARDSYNRQLIRWWGTDSAGNSLRDAQLNFSNVSNNARANNTNAFVPKYNDQLGDYYQQSTLDVLGPGYSEQEQLRTTTQGMFGKGQADLERTRDAVRQGILANQATAEWIQAGIGTRAGASSAAIWASKQLATADTGKQLAEADSNYLTNRRNAEQQYLSNLAAVNAANQGIDANRQQANATVYSNLSAAQQAALNRQQQANQAAAQLQYYRDLLKNKTIPTTVPTTNSNSNSNNTTSQVIPPFWVSSYGAVPAYIY